MEAIHSDQSIEHHVLYESKTTFQGTKGKLYATDRGAFFETKEEDQQIFLPYLDILNSSKIETG